MNNESIKENLSKKIFKELAIPHWVNHFKFHRFYWISVHSSRSFIFFMTEFDWYWNRKKKPYLNVHPLISRQILTVLVSLSTHKHLNAFQTVYESAQCNNVHKSAFCLAWLFVIDACIHEICSCLCWAKICTHVRSYMCFVSIYWINVLYCRLFHLFFSLCSLLAQ